VVTHARLAGSQSASRAWLWAQVNGGSILCSLNVETHAGGRTRRRGCVAALGARNSRGCGHRRAKCLARRRFGMGCPPCGVSAVTTLGIRRKPPRATRRARGCDGSLRQELAAG
jgi:hypothetical protein